MLPSNAPSRQRRRFLRLAGGLAAIAIGLSSLAAASPPDTPTKRFSLPANDATQALAKFAEQSGKQVIYLRDEVRGIRTNAVSGRVTPRVAIERMFAGTSLHVFEDAETGALMVRRESSPPTPHPAPAKPTADSSASDHPAKAP